MIYLYSDILGRSGGIETYLHALAVCLKDQNIPFRVAVSEQEPCPLLDELSGRGIEVYRQPLVPGDRWHIRKRLLIRWLKKRLQLGDWVYCVRQPMPELYLETVRAVHARDARIAASWMFAPEFLRPPDRLKANFNRAVKETDAVISVSHCTAHQFSEIYGYDGDVLVVPYHNLPVFDEMVPLPPAPPFRIGYMGRIEIWQKNLDAILEAFHLLALRRTEVEFHMYGGGPDEQKLKAMVHEMKLDGRVFFHGAYDHRNDLGRIVSYCHIFVHASRFEGGPCFSLLELLQAGRFVVASPVGGIPDIYAGRPEIGCLVGPDDPSKISAALEYALERVAQADVAGSIVRQRYIEAFTNSLAHAAWLKALGLDQQYAMAG